MPSELSSPIATQQVAQVRGEIHSWRDLVWTAKSLDNWFTVLAVDPLALRMLRILARHRKVTPNMVSAAALLLFGCAAAAFYDAGRLLQVVGAILWYSAFLLDCVDGKLARLRGEFTSLGQVLEYLHNLPAGFGCLFAIVVALGKMDVLTLTAGYLYWAYLSATFSLLLLRGWRRRKGSSGHSLNGSDRRLTTPRLAAHRLKILPGNVEAAALVFVLFPLLGALSYGLVAAAFVGTLDVAAWLWEHWHAAGTRGA